MRRREHGFTLLEVMIALAILFGALVVLVGSSHANARAANRARMLTAATGLARAKMLDLEEELLQKGFQDTAETLDGDFSDEGFAKFTWEAGIEKVELPNMGDMQATQGQGTDKAGQPGQPFSGASSLFGGTDPTKAMGSAVLGSQFEIVKGVLENAIRKVTLTVRWKVGHDDEHVAVTCYFTDPKAVDQATGGPGR